MTFLSAFLLCLLVNLTPLIFSLYYADKRIYLYKTIILLFSIITSIGMVLFMYAGKLIASLFIPSVGNIFGALCLSLIGVNYIVQYIKTINEAAGFDTSYYYQSSLKNKKLFPPFSCDNEICNFNDITIYNCVDFSMEFLINNTLIYISAGITGISLDLCVFVNFILLLLFIYLGYLNLKSTIINLLNQHFHLIGGIILIALGLLETFV
jgi:putative Mn2+ efflux pump MntP